MQKYSTRDIGIVVGVIILCYFPLFHHLDRLSIRLWDESRLAVSALEMTQSGDFIVTTFENEPDMWNTKPPLMVWLQAAFMKVFGYSEWSVRLPSAFAGLATLALICLFLMKVLARSDTAIFSVVVLVSCAGYATVHVTRTGDYDALLSLFTTTLVLLTFVWAKSKNTKYLIWIGLSALGIGLTKGVQGYMVIPGLVIYLAIFGNLNWVLSQRKFWLILAGTLLTFLGYYVLRESLNPGYISAVWETELGGRFSRSSGFHAQPFLFYFDELHRNYFPYWQYFLPLGLIFGFRSSDRNIRSFTALIVIVATTYLLLISSSKTKIWWYQTPLLPLFAMLVGVGVSEAMLNLFKFIKLKNRLFNFWLTVVVAIAIGSYPYVKIVLEVDKPKEKDRMNWRQHAVGECWQQLTIPSQLNVTKSKYNSQAIFYGKAASMRGKQIEFYEPAQLPLNQLALVCFERDRKVIKELFQFELIETCASCEVIRIHEAK